MHSNTELRLHVAGTEAKSVLAKLDSAVAFAERMATLEGGCGVLVTRHDYGRFTVSLTQEVPYGLTYERQVWSADAS